MDLPRQNRDVHILMGRIRNERRRRNQRQRQIRNTERNQIPQKWIVTRALSTVASLIRSLFLFLIKIPTFCYRNVAKGLRYLIRVSTQFVSKSYRQCIEKKEEWDRWNPDQENACVICIDDSKLAGLKEIVKLNKPILYRLMWLFIFVVLLILGLCVSTNIYQNAKRNQIRFAFQTYEIEVDDMPYFKVEAFTPCAFKSSILDEIKQMVYAFEKGDEIIFYENQKWSPKEVYALVNFVDHLCKSYQTVSSHLGLMNSSISLSDLYLEEQLNGIQLTDDGNNSLYLNKIFPFVLRGLYNCGDIVKFCHWKGIPQEECQSYFSEDYSSVGGSCSFNKMPDEDVFERKDSVRTILNLMRNQGNKIKSWGNWSLDSHDFSDKVETEDQNQKELKEVKGPLRQQVAGFPGGLTTILSYNNENAACPQFDSTGNKVAISIPGVNIDAKNLILAIQPGHESFVTLYPSITKSDDNIRDVSIELRGCYFEDEQKLNYYKHYNQENCHNECKSDYLRKECGCSLLHLPNPKGAILCKREKFSCIEKAQNKLYGKGFQRECPKCLPTCTQMSLRHHITSSPLQKSVAKAIGSTKQSPKSIAHFAYGSNTEISNARQLDHTNSELFARVGGIFETTNDISILGAIRVFLSFLINLIPAIVAFLLLSLYKCYSNFCKRKQIDVQVIEDDDTAPGNEASEEIPPNNVADPAAVLQEPAPIPDQDDYSTPNLEQVIRYTEASFVESHSQILNTQNNVPLPLIEPLVQLNVVDLGLRFPSRIRSHCSTHSTNNNLNLKKEDRSKYSVYLVRPPSKSKMISIPSPEIN